MRGLSYVISYFGRSLENNQFIKLADKKAKNVMPLIGLNIYVAELKKNEQRFSIYIRELLDTKYSKGKDNGFSNLISDDLCKGLFERYLFGSDALIIDADKQPEELVNKIISAYKLKNTKNIISINNNKWSDNVAESLEQAIEQVISDKKQIEK